jgi:hypothetical protein
MVASLHWGAVPFLKKKLVRSLFFFPSELIEVKAMVVESDACDSRALAKGCSLPPQRLQVQDIFEMLGPTGGEKTKRKGKKEKKGPRCVAPSSCFFSSGWW